MGAPVLDTDEREKRRFERYSVDKEMRLIFKGEVIPAKLVNISEEGAGIIIDSKSLKPDQDRLFVIRCEVGNEIVDLSMEIRHYREQGEQVYVGAQLVHKMKDTLLTYIQAHKTYTSQAYSIDSEGSEKFLHQIRMLTSQALENGVESRVVDSQEGSELLRRMDWISFIGLSSTILTSRIYLSYCIDGADELCKRKTGDSDGKIHDFMREKTNVVAGFLKRWILNHKDLKAAKWGDFLVKMPSTERLDEQTCDLIGSAQHGLLWEMKFQDSFTMVGCALLQIDNPEEADEFLKKLSSSCSIEPDSDDDIEFL